MTEAEGDDVGSVCKLLAPLMCLPEHVSAMQLFAPENSAHLATLSLALMAEAASRGARAAVAVHAAKARRRADRAAAANGSENSNGSSAGGASSLAEAAHAMLVKVMAITEDQVAFPTPDDVPEPKTVTHADDYDRAHALAASGAFFGKQWPTNTSLPAVMSALTFARALSTFGAHKTTADWSSVEMQALADHLLRNFEHASMASFFADFVPVPLAASASDFQAPIFIFILFYFCLLLLAHFMHMVFWVFRLLFLCKVC